MGPTASGKTDAAITLTQELPCDIVSVDSAMVYRSMDIGTAKPSMDVLAAAPHRLLDIRNPNETYSAGEFREDAIREIDSIIAKQRIPLLVGGTMLYFHVLQNGIAELPQANSNIREKISNEAQHIGWTKLHERLQQIDPVSAKRIHPNDPQRLQRALEIYELTGKTLTEFWQETTERSLPYQFINIALSTPDRSLLHQKIELRFKAMLKQGFIEEVEQLAKYYDLNCDLPSIIAKYGIIYKEHSVITKWKSAVLLPRASWLNVN
jgi:tRNA dimethylallyltransferase